MVFRAFEVAHPGDVIVIESRGYTSVAQWGDLMSLVAKQLGLGGMVTDGSLRDVTGISESGFPVFAQSVITPNGAIKDGPGEVNVPVAVGGVPVLPGDIVVGDSHGVVVVPRKDARVVVSRARANVAAETLIVERIKSGRIDEDWLRPAAKIADAKGCEVVGGTWIDQKEGA
jgi:regulator of RNase E activity RraA